MNIINDWNELTPIEERGGYFVKRDDLFCINGAYGGKARVISRVLEQRISKGIKSFVTCGSRDSRQCEAMAKICDLYDVDCHIFMPRGKETQVIAAINETNHSTIHYTKVGYNNVVISNAKLWSKENESEYIPFGLEFQETIDINMHQVKNIPIFVKRIVVPCGGGMNMASIIKGIDTYLQDDIEVTGVVVGKDPKNTLERFVGTNGDIFGCNVRYDLVKSECEYHKKATDTNFYGIELDDVYEAKCLPFLKNGDLLWIVGRR